MAKTLQMIGITLGVIGTAGVAGYIELGSKTEGLMSLVLIVLASLCWIGAVESEKKSNKYIRVHSRNVHAYPEYLR